MVNGPLCRGQLWVGPQSTRPQAQGVTSPCMGRANFHDLSVPGFSWALLNGNTMEGVFTPPGCILFFLSIEECCHVIHLTCTCHIKDWKSSFCYKENNIRSDYEKQSSFMFNEMIRSSPAYDYKNIYSRTVTHDYYWPLKAPTSLFLNYVVQANV